MVHRKAAFVLACAQAIRLTAAAPVSSAGGLSGSILNLIRVNLAQNDNDSWVAGTETQAVLELDYPGISVFSPGYLSNDTVPLASNAIIDGWAAQRPAGAKQMAVVQGGAAADSASLGVAWSLAVRTTPADSATYQDIVLQQLDYLRETIPHLADNTMSMRGPEEPIQLWSDFIYMVPPFLAFAGASSNDESLVLEAYNQCRLYRSHLQDRSTKLWRHIVLGTWGDSGLWSTGNAWAAAGMTRVIATILNEPSLSEKLQSEAADLIAWTNEILTAAWSRADVSGLLPNYFDAGSFRDSASTALMAAATLRLEQLSSNVTASNLLIASRARLAVNAKVDRSTGWLHDVVDPLNFKDKIQRSPEGQAFLMLLEAAYRDS